MQNLLILSLIFLFFFNQMLAQEGLKIGVHFIPGASIAINNEDTEKGKMLALEASFAYNTGILMGYGITEIFSISTGVQYHQHTANFIHNRNLLSTGLNDPNTGKKFSRRTAYVRVPLFLEFCSDPNQVIGIFARLGPHFDFLVNATYKDARLEGFSQYDAANGIDLQQKITLYQKNSTGNGIISLGRKGRIYRSFVPGITAEVGAQVRISDFLKMTFLIHVEGSSNPEGEGAASLAHNLNRGDYLVTSNPISNPNNATVDNLKSSQEETPFDTVFPNYIDETDPNVTFRSPTWNLMAGFQIGFIYTYIPQ